MNGSTPKPPKFSNPPKPPKTPRKARRRSQSLIPWVSIAVLFVLEVVTGFLMTFPQPPYWVWIVMVLSVPMVILGLNRPLQADPQRDRTPLLSYLGALLRVIALSVSINYIGRAQGYDDVAFMTAVLVLLGLTVLAVLLTALVAILSAQIGTKLTATGTYSRSLSYVFATTIFGLSFGAICGFAFAVV